MKINRWHKIEEIFNQAITLPYSERKSFVSRKCCKDTELYSEILLLLEGDKTKEYFIDSPVFDLGARLIEDEYFERLKKNDFSHYKLKKLLGRGGMGAVFLAEDTRLGRNVAIKILPLNSTGEENSFLDLHREARAASAVTHPNIAHIYEYSSSGEQFFLAMEFVSGKTLRELVKNRAIDQLQAIDFIQQIASALQAAHNKGIIHRDIKPENIIISDDGIAKVLDFGLAKCENLNKYNEFGAADFDKYSNLIIGTVSYMAPEQIHAKAADERSDIWSLGIVFYEMLTGVRPFDRDNSHDTVKAILKEEPPLLSALDNKIPLFIERMIQKMLSKNIDDRYQNMADFLRDLKKFEDSQGVEGKENDSTSNKLNAFGKYIDYLMRHKFIFAALLLLILLFGGFNSSTFFERSTGGAHGNGKLIKSIAVLPFGLTNNSEKSYLAQGLTETIISKLSNVPEIVVKARDSTFYYQNKSYDPLTIGRALSAETLLTGTISEIGDELVIDVKLIESETGKTIWNKSYSDSAAQLIYVEDEIANDVSDFLRTGLSANDKAKILKNSTISNQAYDDYLKGRFHWSKRTAKDLEKSIEYFEHATQIDPNFALAYAGLADSYVLLSGYGVSTPHESFSRAKQAAQKALEIDETLAEAHCALGYVLFNYEWKFDESETEMKRAIELNPNYATAYHWYGNANLLAAGRFDESIAAMKKAQELDPLSLIVNADLGTNYLFARRIDDSIEQLNRTIELDEHFYYAHAYLGRAFLMKHEFGQALAEYKKAQKTADDPRVLMLLARTYTAMNQKSGAEKILIQLKAMKSKRYISDYYFALIYAGLNNKDKAFEHLEKALEHREGRMTLIKVDPLLDNIRSDARFPVLLRKVGLEK